LRSEKASREKFMKQAEKCWAVKTKKAKKLAKEKKMKKMLKSSGVLMLAVVVGLTLNVGCEDSELSRLLGLSKKKNDSSAQQSQETNSQSAVENAEETATKDSENSEAKESESKESDSQDGTQSNNDNLNQNNENTSDTQNNNGGSNQDESLQQTQSDGNTNGQVNDGESQTPAIQAGDISQTQAPETAAGIQPMDIAVPANKNYIKVLQISGIKHPNDSGYAGTWEYFDPTPVGTERIRYDTQNPKDVDEVGTWEFVLTRTMAYVDVKVLIPGPFAANASAAHIGSGVTIEYPKGNNVPYQVPNTAVISGTMIDTVSSGSQRDFFGGEVVVIVQNNPTTAGGTVTVNQYWIKPLVAVSELPGRYWLYRISVEQEYPTAQLNRNNIWKKTTLSTSPATNRMNNWGRVN
jgi:hypothetical protein